MQINVAFCNRPSYDNPLGGDAIQMLKTKEWLEILYGIHISIITHPNELTVNFNIVHVFNFATYEITNGFVEKAHQLGIPIISSCITTQAGRCFVTFAQQDGHTYGLVILGSNSQNIFREAAELFDWAFTSSELHPAPAEPEAEPEKHGLSAFWHKVFG